MTRPREGRGPPNYSEVSWFSFFTFGWVTPVVTVGVQRQVNVGDTPELGREEDTVRNANGLLRSLADAEERRKEHPLLRALLATFWLPLLELQSLQVMGHFLGLVGPLLMQQVLIFQEKQNERALDPGRVQQGLMAVFLLILLGLFMIFWNSQVQLFQNRLGVRMGSALRGAVLTRCIQARPAQRRARRAEEGEGAAAGGGSGPVVYNVLSFDVGPNVDVVWILLGLWLFPVQLSSTLYVLFQQVEWAVVPGLMTILVAKTICGVLLFQDGLLRHRLLEAKDARLGLCGEGFNQIRTLQMLAWVAPFEKRILAARERELRLQSLRLWMTKMVAALDYSLGTIVTLATLSYYVSHTNGELKASVAIPVIALVNGLAGPFGQFPIWLQQYLVWRSAYDRVNDFMGLEVFPSRGVASRVNGRLIGLPSTPPPPDLPAGTAAAFENCTVAWGALLSAPKTEENKGKGDVEEGKPPSQPLLTSGLGFALQDLDLQVREGELTALVGQAGQGKSSLLHGLLGEMVLEAGTLHSPAVGRQAEALPEDTAEARILLAQPAMHAEGMVPYAPQSPMLFTGSVRYNVLLGAPFRQKLYDSAVQACALEGELAALPAGDATELAQGGATLSGGQRARLGLARAVYLATLALEERPGSRPLVLLDDPFCSLDQKVAAAVCRALFAPPGGLLCSCAVVVATADPWWLGGLLSLRNIPVRVSVLRQGRLVAGGPLGKLQGLDLPELASMCAGQPEEEVTVNPQEMNPQEMNPQDMDEAPQQNPQEDASPIVTEPPAMMMAVKSKHSSTQTPLTDVQKDAASVVQDEARVEGHVHLSTYSAYLAVIGWRMLMIIGLALAGIMVFQNCCSLWIVYWTEEDKSKTFVYRWATTVMEKPPTAPQSLLRVYACFVLLFTLCNFAGHATEIVAGINAARRTFKEAMLGALGRPFLWWDANPTGRVLNRFSQDVEVMDTVLTSTMGVIFGAVLYFVGHTFVLALANPLALLLLPPIAAGLEYFAGFYRATIREVHRNFLVCMSTVYQDMVEAIVGRVVLRAHAAERLLLCRSMDSLDRFQQVGFAKYSVQAWLGFRMSLVGYCLSIFTQLRPVLQYMGLLAPQSAALVGFSIAYSSELVGIIQQFINNYSDLEMQFISIERLREYSLPLDVASAAICSPTASLGPGLHLRNVEVKYKSGLRPALHSVNLDFAPQELVAITGRTGAGKSSLLLSVLQLVPYSGLVQLDGQNLATLPPTQVRRALIGVVPQTPVVFSGDLASNLDPEAEHSEAELWSSLEAVGLAGTCRSRGQGLKVELGGGTSAGCLELSQGQRQLLCAARALLRRPKVALLDEVTASLPQEAAAGTVGTLFRRFRERGAAVLLVTHQASLLALCQRAITIADGQVKGDRRL